MKEYAQCWHAVPGTSVKYVGLTSGPAACERAGRRDEDSGVGT
jgi:hypothetical protein